MPGSAGRGSRPSATGGRRDRPADRRGSVTAARASWIAAGTNVPGDGRHGDGYPHAVEIRAFDPGRGDGAATYEVFLRAVRSTASRHYDAAQVSARSAADPADWVAARQRHHTLVADDGTRIVGVADLDPAGWIDVLFVDPNVGGRGVGARLVRAVVAEARRRGAPRLRTYASLTAQPLLTRLGFRTTRERHPVVRGQSFRNAEMELVLDASTDDALSGAACATPSPPAAGTPSASGRS